jgi:hypothetical protein
MAEPGYSRFTFTIDPIEITKYKIIAGPPVALSIEDPPPGQTFTKIPEVVSTISKIEIKIDASPELALSIVQILKSIKA